jgi:hypothetical protein
MTKEIKLSKPEIIQRRRHHMSKALHWEGMRKKAEANISFHDLEARRYGKMLEDMENTHE